jgi:SAM-dependent methyltransferase
MDNFRGIGLFSYRLEDKKTEVNLNSMECVIVSRSEAFTASQRHKASATPPELVRNMKTQSLRHFQTDGETWEKRAEKGKLPAVIDPGDLKGRKNLYIDTLQKMTTQKALGQGKKEIIIDFGCGSGRFSDLLSEHCEFLVSLEITPQMLKIAKHACENSNIGFVLYDGLNLPLKGNKTDLLVSINVLQYIAEKVELEKILREIRKCLKPQGELICIEQVTKNKKRWQRDFKTYLNLFKQNNFKKIADYPIRKGHFLWLYPVLLGFVPKRFFKILARYEMLLRRILWHSLWDYQDHLFKMRKT